MHTCIHLWFPSYLSYYNPKSDKMEHPNPIPLPTVQTKTLKMFKSNFLLHDTNPKKNTTQQLTQIVQIFIYTV